jgi:hypothetical protein
MQQPQVCGSVGVGTVSTGEEKAADGWAMLQFQNHSNFHRSKQDLAELKHFEIKYGFEGFYERAIFPYRNFLRFEMDVELKIWESSRFEFE